MEDCRYGKKVFIMTTATERRPHIGIVQGRLLPRIDGKIQAFPADRWADEFPLLERAGFDCIELIFDGPQNPLLSDAGVEQIARLSRDHHIEISSVSGDYHMYHPIFGKTRPESVRLLKHLIEQCAKIGIRRVNVPLEEISGLNNRADVDETIESLAECWPLAEKHNMIIATECSLPPNNFLAFMKKVGHPLFKINYDLGNSCASGYPTDYALEILSPYLAGIHVKDRTRLFGTTVPLGTGDTDFRSHFQTLKRVGYRGPITIQGARGDDDVATAVMYLQFVRNLFEEVNGGNGNG